MGAGPLALPHHPFERSIGPDRFQIDLELVDEIAKTKSGKLRQIVVEME